MGGTSTWIQRQADTGRGLNCYLFTSYGNQSQLFLNSEAALYCRALAVDAYHVPRLLSVDTQAEKVFWLQHVETIDVAVRHENHTG